MKYGAVLFDLDGTLLDTLQDIADSVNCALARFGFPQHELEAYRYFVGDGREALAMRTLPEHSRDTTTINKHIDYINEEYARRWTNNTHTYQGVPELLDTLTAREMKMAILSNKPHYFTDLMVSGLLSKWSFEVVSGSQPNIPRKPDPTAALRIAEQLTIHPNKFIYLGDSGIDMKTAVAAGMYPVGALWGFRENDELVVGGAKTLVQQPKDLLALL
jgi:phosphoglycolate phosphatase